MIEIIHQDHKNIMQLLQVLRSKLTLLKMDEKIDYHLLKDIVSYLKNYSDTYHHAMEDIIYSHYLKYRIVPKQIAEQLSDDHKSLKKITHELDDMLSMILLDVVIKENIIEKLEVFVTLQEQHLSYEEREILPAIKSALTVDDWLTLEREWQHLKYDDPLFGDNVSEEFQLLAERIKHS